MPRLALYFLFCSSLVSINAELQVQIVGNGDEPSSVQLHDGPYSDAFHVSGVAWNCSMAAMLTQVPPVAQFSVFSDRGLKVDHLLQCLQLYGPDECTADSTVPESAPPLHISLVEGARSLPIASDPSPVVAGAVHAAFLVSQLCLGALIVSPEVRITDGRMITLGSYIQVYSAVPDVVRLELIISEPLGILVRSGNRRDRVLILEGSPSRVRDALSGVAFQPPSGINGNSRIRAELSRPGFDESIVRTVYVRWESVIQPSPLPADPDNLLIRGSSMGRLGALRRITFSQSLSDFDSGAAVLLLANTARTLPANVVISNVMPASVVVDFQFVNLSPEEERQATSLLLLNCATELASQGADCESIDNPNEEGSTLSSGVIIAIVLGSLVAALLLGCLVAAFVLGKSKGSSGGERPTPSYGVNEFQATDEDLAVHGISFDESVKPSRMQHPLAEFQLPERNWYEPQLAGPMSFQQAQMFAPAPTPQPFGPFYDHSTVDGGYVGGGGGVAVDQGGGGADGGGYTFTPFPMDYQSQLLEQSQLRWQ
eukprot:NODE_901_length_1837_cov_22.704698_g794_i0.p1 GENE.NODE_901_length_1837_cov_22.704698_g794_i0~~NODE_901_length_1837_cov_22.704698_g794_i0.p1  ORF type:complete len:561 (+),score=103.83 NODE_901_length_1837_cov_22.704698_g794_i0:62-1684(+)